MSGKALLGGPVGILANVSKRDVIAAVNAVIAAVEACGLPWRMDQETAARCGIAGGALPLSRMLEQVAWLLVLGGDGTILRAVRESWQQRLPLLGVNPGNSLGFMTDTLVQDLPAALARICAGQYDILERATLAASVIGSDAEAPTVLPPALNDVTFIHGAVARLIALEVFVNGEFFTTYEADGLIFATPTGSTAHSMAAGGPIVFPATEAVVLTPICPHTLTNRPSIFPRGYVIEVRLGNPGHEVHVSVDGQVTRLLQASEKVVIKMSENHVRFIHCSTQSFVETLRQKLHWRGRLRDDRVA